MVPDDLTADVPVSGEQMSKILTWDWDFVNEKQGELAERWAKTITVNPCWIMAIPVATALIGLLRRIFATVELHAGNVTIHDRG